MVCIFDNEGLLSEHDRPLVGLTNTFSIAENICSALYKLGESET